jgi:ring-1,2-phenylacetyl-CoA epoxidase subunit PaaC
MKIENVEQAMQHKRYTQVLKDLLYQLADDELTLGHRDSEWLGLSPDIEGDVAFSSIAQDEVGHAAFYFERLHELGEQDPDHLAFARPISLRRNAVLLERGNGDWAFSIARHYLYDIFDDLRLSALVESSYLPLAQGAVKIKREEYYHLLHMHLWFTRLGQAGGEAKERLERAMRKIWQDIDGLLSFGTYEQELIEFGIMSITPLQIRTKWCEIIEKSCQEAGIAWPGPYPKGQINGRLGQHTEELDQLMGTMSEVYHLDPSARW